MNVIIKNNTNIKPSLILESCERIIKQEKDWKTITTEFVITDTKPHKVKITCRKREHITFTVEEIPFGT